MPNPPKQVTHQPVGEPNEAELSPQAMRDLVQNLRLHQTELEAQNEELRRTQAALNSAEARYFDFYDLAPVGYVTVSLLAVILQANLAMATQLGERREGLVGKVLTSFMDASDADIFYLLCQKVLASHSSHVSELRIRNAKGDTCWVKLQAIAAQGEAGVAVIRLVVSDISRRRELEEANREESENRFRLVANNTSDGIVIFDAEGCINYVSPSYLKHLGYSGEEELLAHSLEMVYALVHPDDREALRSNVDQAIDTASSDLTHTYRVKHKLGHYVWREASIKLQHDVSGRFFQACAVIRDVTQRKRAEDHLHETYRDLAQSRQSLRALIALNETNLEKEKRHIAREVHDELGQVLTTLRMDLSLALLRYANLAPTLPDELAAMKTQVDRAIHGVRNVANSLRPAVLDMGLVPAIQWLRNEFSRQGGIACEFTAPEEPIELDASRAVVVFRIVQESLTNIRRYAQASQVYIALSLHGKELSVSVRDNGVGFDTAAVALRGTLGLLGMRERVMALCGSVEVSSKPGEGTCILVVVPLAAAAAVEPA